MHRFTTAGNIARPSPSAALAYGTPTERYVPDMDLITMILAPFTSLTDTGSSCTNWCFPW